MLSSDDIRRLALEYPETHEFRHFGIPAFRVGKRACAGFDKGGRTAVFSVSEDEGSAAVVADPIVYQEVWRNGATTSWVGLRVDLTAATEELVHELIDHAWRNKALKRVVAAYDAR
ncbi:MAG: MmcQ/YjbR family DNA-binding protein [Actinomycetota bacterium]|nr:MmcQ/YjbR family DNA-binding protein [Actinomycetota bacterium]